MVGYVTYRDGLPVNSIPTVLGASEYSNFMMETNVLSTIQLSWWCSGSASDSWSKVGWFYSSQLGKLSLQSLRGR